MGSVLLLADIIAVLSISSKVPEDEELGNLQIIGFFE